MITEIKTKSYDEWRELRSHYIGGSDAASVVGLNPFKSAYALWAEKTGKIAPFEGNLATEVGTYLEEFVAKKFEEETGKKVRRHNRSILNSEYPFAIANIDREIVGEDAGLEIKTTSEMNLKKFKNGEYPENYYAQCVHYLAVTGKKKWYLAVLIGNREFKWFVIDRDEEEIKALMNAENDLWKCVESNISPGVDGTKSTSDTITVIYPGSNDDSVNLMAYNTYLQEYVSLAKRIKELEALQKEAANSIKAYMGDAGYGESDGFKVSWKSSERTTFDVKKFVADNPSLDLSNYYNTTQIRTFRITERG